MSKIGKIIKTILPRFDENLCEECRRKPWEVESLGKKFCNNCYGTNFRQAHESW